MPKILAFSTLGSGSNEEARILELLRNFDVQVFAFDRTNKRQMFRDLRRTIREIRPDLVVMEGSGLAGGLAILLGRWFNGVPYVVSSGDAIGPWVRSHKRWAGPMFSRYERMLCANAAGFIGWTPYLVGRAMTFGSPGGVTAAGWAPFARSAEEYAAARERTRQRLGIAPDAFVIGIAGAMIWNQRFGFCYGWEIVKALSLVQRKDVVGLLVGDGTGRAELEKMAANLPAGRAIFTGRVPQAEVPDYLAAMDLGSLPQTVDATGSFRYTTKISEYLDARLPMVTNCVPMGYDLDDGWVIRLPGPTPWHATAVQAMVECLETMTPEKMAALRSTIPPHHPLFDRERQVAHVTAYIHDLLTTSK